MRKFTRLPFVLISGAALCLVVMSIPLGAAPAPRATAAPSAQAESSLPADVNAESRSRLSTFRAPDPAGGPSAAANTIRERRNGSERALGVPGRPSRCWSSPS